MAEATAYVDDVGFIPVSSGTGDFVDSAAVVGYQRLSVVGVTGKTYSYRAESADKSQWERGWGVATNAAGTWTLARTNIKSSSTGSKVSFSAAPNVYIVASDVDLGNASMLNSGTVADALLSNTITAGGPTGSSSLVPVITYDAHGRLTAVTTASITTSKQADQQVFTGSGTWTKPSGFGAKASALIQCWGGGVGGAKNNSTQDSGGGGGGYKYRWISLSSLGATETVTVAAGSAGSSSSTQTAGGNTTFGSWVTAYGGGAAAGINASGGGGASAAGGWQGYSDANAAAQFDDPSGYSGGIGFQGTSGFGGGNSVWGGGGGGNGTVTTAGTSQNAGNGGAGSSAGAAGAGTAPAGGGGGTKTGTAGAGARGECRVTVFDGA